MRSLNIQEVATILPHRYPMLLIDRILDLKEGQFARGLHNVSFSENYVNHNLAKQVSFPRPLIIETMAQTGAVALLCQNEFTGKTAYFGGIQEAEFFADAKPGDQMIIETTLTKIKGQIGVGQGVVKVDDKLIAKAELTFMIG